MLQHICTEVTDKMLTVDAGRNFFFKKARSKVMKMSHGLYPAPLKILDVSSNTVIITDERYEN